MFEDTDLPRKPAATRVLDTLSIAELESYIAELEGEIGRVHREIAAKQDHARAAASFFRPDGA